MSLAVAALFLSASSVPADDEKKADAKTTAVKLQDLTLMVPDTWKEAPNTSNMRLATYKTPTADGDSEGGELTVFSFPGGGGDVGANISRWVQQFGGEGRTSKVTRGKAGGNEYYLADIAGTYNKPVGPPILRKTEPAAGFRMLGAIVVLEGKGVYYLKLTGPDASVKAQADHFRAAFGGAKASETDYEL
ncbi:MAG: hypothetical protein R3C49_13280 [Planctomycetaceae bacterium]